MVSAIVSTYNSEKFIRGCLDDLINQTLYERGELEIVVVNSGSKQNEENIVKDYIKKHSNITYIRTERETIYQAWNRGIKSAKGKYITNANTDDRHKPDAFEKMVYAFENNPDVDVVYGNIYNTTIPNDTWASAKPKTETNWIPFDSDLILFGCFLGPQPMWKKNLHDKFGYFDEGLKVVGDYEFWVRISHAAKFLHIEEKLGLYYYSQESVEHRNQLLTDKEHSKVQEKYFNVFVSTMDDIKRIKAKLEIIKKAMNNDEYYNKAMKILCRREKGLLLYNSIIDLIKHSAGYPYEQLIEDSKKIEILIEDDGIIDNLFVENYYCIMGVVHIKNENLSKARLYFENALKKNDKLLHAYLGLAEVNYAEENFEDSRNMFETALKIEPGNIIAVNGLKKNGLKISGNISEHNNVPVN